MTPALRKLDTTVGIWIVLGPILLVAGLALAFSSPGLMPLIGAVCASFGGILLIGALVGKIVMLAVQALDESGRARSLEVPAVPSDRDS